jgi:hypothetical protein
VEDLNKRPLSLSKYCEFVVPLYTRASGWQCIKGELPITRTRVEEQDGRIVATSAASAPAVTYAEFGVLSGFHTPRLLQWRCYRLFTPPTAVQSRCDRSCPLSKQLYNVQLRTKCKLNGEIAVMIDWTANWGVTGQVTGQLLARGVTNGLNATNILHKSDIATRISGATTWALLLGNALVPYYTGLKAGSQGCPGAIYAERSFGQ